MQRYRGYIADTIRWQGFEHRADDIVISTPAKSGTTWTQRCVALLLFGPELPASLSTLSPWFDMHIRTPEEARAMVSGQAHRRFLKTHAPLDGLPLDPRVTYLVVGRDPRDVWVSMAHHLENMTEEADRLRFEKWGDHDLDELERVDWPEDPAEKYALQLELDRGENHTAVRLAHLVHHLRDAWERRAEPNVHLFHYADLQADLPRELGRMAAAIGVEAPPQRLAELAEHASLDAMRADAARMAPDGHLSVWKDPANFFRSGRSGDWRHLVTPAVEERYDARVAELTAGDRDLAAWIHGGWGALA